MYTNELKKKLLMKTSW